MSGLTDKDLGDVSDRIIAEIGLRMKDTKAMSSPQLLSAAREVNKMIALRNGSHIEATNIGGEDLDLFSLVERLPAAQRKKHLNNERVRLEERLTRVTVALGGK